MNLFGRKNSDEENTEQEGKQTRRGPSPFLWLIVGAYLLYIDYSIVTDIIAEGIGAKNWYFLVFVALFAACAVWLFIRSFKQLKEEKEKNDQDYEELVAEEEEERKLREMYTIEELEAFEAEQAKFAAKENSKSEDDNIQE